MIIESTFNVKSKQGKSLIEKLDKEENRLPLIKEDGYTLQIEEIAYYTYERETNSGKVTTEAIALFSTDGLVYTTTSSIVIKTTLKLIEQWEGETLAIGVEKRTSTKGFTYLTITV